MKYSVPNAPDAVALDQAEPDDFDFQALGNRRTGIVRGGEVIALGTPGPSVQVSEGMAIIMDEPVSFSGGTVAVASGGGNARFDIIAVSDQGVLVNIAGAASANAMFTNFNFNTYCPLASVYVPPGSTDVLGSHITSKSTSMPSSFARTYDTATARFLSSKGPGATFQVYAEGDHSWGVSRLKRVTDYAMEWATSLLLKAADEALAVLILRGRATNAAAQKVLQVQGSAGNELAYINGDGQLYADNLKFGTGNPNGVVLGKKGDVFVSRDNGGSSLGIWQKGGNSGTMTNWLSFRVYDPSESALPTGSLVYTLSATAPTGFIFPIGQWIDTTGPTAALAALLGSHYGSQTNQVRMPDLRGFTLAFCGGGLGFRGTIGAYETYIGVPNLPPHSHPVNDPTHTHPQAGPLVYMRPYQFHNNRHPTPSNQPLEHLYTEPGDFNKYAETGISVGNTGGGAPISNFQPTHAVNLLVKL